VYRSASRGLAMNCAKCQREIAPERVRVAVMLGDGRAALDWPCFEAMLKPGRGVELMRIVREVTLAARAVHERERDAGE
jgi:hypothetical protein